MSRGAGLRRTQRRLRIAIALLAVVTLLPTAVAVASVGASSAAKDTLVVLNSDVAVSLDYDSAAVGLPLAEMIINLMEPLVGYPRKDDGKGVLVPNYNVGSQEFEPRLATSWTKKGLVWTFKLRQGVKSCAGNELTADDVVYTFARARSVSGSSPISWFVANVGSITPLDPLTSKDPKAKQLQGEVKKLDRYTVQFTQFAPNDLFPRILEIYAVYIFDSVEMKKHATAKDPWSHDYTTRTNSPGFGAYCLTSWAKGTEIVVTANPEYFGAKPQFKKVIVRKVAANANRVASLQRGAADIVTALTPQEYDRLRSDSKVSVLSWRNYGFLQLGINSGIAPWNIPNNQLIRQAIAFALPYKEITKTDYFDLAYQMRGLPPHGIYGFKPINTYGTDLVKAKALLAKAGFPGGKGLEQYAGGFKLFFVAERKTLLEPIANRIRTALAAIGVNLSLEPITQAEFLDRENAKRDMAMFIRDENRPLAPDVGYYSLLYQVSKEKGGLVTPSQYSNPEFDALYAKQVSLAGPARLAVLAKMQEILMRDLPLIPIAMTPSHIAVRKGITGWAGQGADVLYYAPFKSS